ncbi:MAG: T9SS type A sorting domain-containing protein [Bacteroidota bacterium]
MKTFITFSRQLLAALALFFLTPELGAQCVVQANFNYQVDAFHAASPDTIFITNTTISNGGFSNYRVTAYNAGGSVVFTSSSLSPTATASIVVPHDTLWNVCIYIEDTSGVCSDSICKLLWTTPCTTLADFNWDMGSSALLLYNTSIGSHGIRASAWTITGGTPSSSTDNNPVLAIPANVDSITVCLTTTDNVGCSASICSLLTRTDTLCGIIFTDANRNGIYDVGELPGLGCSIWLDGVLYFPDGGGYYNVVVGSGTHSIFINSPFGWTQSFPINPINHTITTTGNEHICGLDFGIKDDTLTLSGVVYSDNNGNGLYDLGSGDVPLSNQSVQITGSHNGFNVQTNAGGLYSTVVFVDNYTLSHTPDTGRVITQPISPNRYFVAAGPTSISGLNFGSFIAATITGRVYIDTNNNNVYNPGEILVRGERVNVGGVSVFTNSLGQYSVARPVGMNLVTYSSSLATSTPTSYNVNAAIAGNTYGGNDFALHIIPGTSDVCVALSAFSRVVAGFPARYYIRVRNQGYTPMAGVLTMHYDPAFNYVNSVPTPSSVNTSTRTLTWNVVPFPGHLDFKPYFDCPGTVPLGTAVMSFIEFVPDSGYVDVNPDCNFDTLRQITVAAYDPNDKEVDPVGALPNGRITGDEELNYTIHFQNTGTSPAVNVIIIDTLETNLDIATFEMHDASHDYHLQIEGRILTWIFSNIMLPDSGTDFDNSMGFVSFKIKPLAGLGQRTEIVNRAGIYFDYNEVVVTNEVLNTIDFSVSVDDLVKGDVSISLFPNPFDQETTLKIEGTEGPYELLMYDLLGKQVKRVMAYNNVFTIQRENLASGMYVFEIIKENELLGKGKMIAE